MDMIVSLLKSAARFNTESFIPAVYSMFNEGFWNTYQFEENVNLVVGCTNNYLGPIKAFTLDKIRNIFVNEGMKIDRLSSIGSLSNHCGKEFFNTIKSNFELFNELLNCVIDLTKRYALIL